MKKHSPAFTLIELLIVVAIIAILAAIAVPNFLEAQVRAKVSRAGSDMRTIATGLETYFTDNNKYPDCITAVGYIEKLKVLSTPIAYISSVPESAFKLYQPFMSVPTGVYYYQNREACKWMEEQGWGVNIWEQYTPNGSDRFMWYLSCVGPDGDYDQLWSGDPSSNYNLYDPTNGTVSSGDIIRLGP